MRVPSVIAAGETDSQRTKAIEVRLDLSSKLFDIGIILLGVLWGLVLADTIVIKFSRGTDVALFASSNVLLLLSLFFHLLYKRRIAALQWDLAPKQPDIFSKHVNYLFQTQWLFFFASLVTGFFTILSAKILEG
jgi:hypothetical protein